MLRIEVKGDLKSGKTTIAALIYSLLGDYGIEAEIQGFESEQLRRMAQEEPEALIKRVRAIAESGQKVVIVEKQLKRGA